MPDPTRRKTRKHRRTPVWRQCPRDDQHTPHDWPAPTVRFLGLLGHYAAIPDTERASCTGRSW